MLAAVHSPGDTRDLVQESAQDLLAVRRMQHLGVVLDAGEATRTVLERGDGCTCAGGGHLESFGCNGHAVTVAHPHRLRRGQTVVQHTTGHRQVSAAVLTGSGVRDRASESIRHGLEAVADAEHRDVQVEQLRVEFRSAGLVHARGAAGQDHRKGFLGCDLIDARGVRNNLRIDVGLAHASCDQLCVLGSEVDDEYGSGLLGLRHPNSLSGRARASGRGRSGPT